ncbi:sensor histidine kinase [Paenibacillus hamazuiensis]|uniref:sensor histidine kinase n=1 Tax=Paenibacillus hamazuiensis TaxID=2936508 RepID=UPI00200CED29|nr:HAMP domain-containing sensor histidine kinase [Paenibacillus hamazuiensis]
MRTEVRRKLWRRVALGLSLMFSGLAIGWFLAYWGTAWAYLKIGWTPEGVARELVNNFLGFFFLFAVMSIIGRIYRRNPQVRFVESLIAALRQIAKGDFNVNLENKEPVGPFNELVDSINDMASQLGQMEKMRQEFVSNVSHEIQTPLASISGFARALRKEDLTPHERNHYLDIIETESKRLARLSDNLLKLTSLESQHHPFELRPYRLDRQLQNLIVVCEPQWADKDIEMSAELDKLSVTADEELMSQVWINLIHNSIKFTPQGGAIHIRLRRNGEYAEVDIRDNGIGMNGEDQAHMFERFYKADKSRNRAAGGSGLGLAIVKKIVDMHGGAIRVVSRPGEGTTVTVALPRAENV